MDLSLDQGCVPRTSRGGCCRRCGCRAPPVAALGLTWRTGLRPPPPFGSQGQFPDKRDKFSINSTSHQMRKMDRYFPVWGRSFCG